MKRCKKCNNDKIRDECSFLFNENKQFETDPNLLQRKTSNHFDYRIIKKNVIYLLCEVNYFLIVVLFYTLSFSYVFMKLILTNKMNILLCV